VTDEIKRRLRLCRDGPDSAPQPRTGQRATQPVASTAHNLVQTISSAQNRMSFDIIGRVSAP
jgi:hypothetical protein